jgi:hypothetical protein
MRIPFMQKMALVVMALALFSSCSGGDSVHIKLEETPVISGGLGWGVVSLAYVRLMAEPSMKAADSGAMRRSEVARITARSRSFDDRDQGVWYKVELDSRTGWVHESSMRVYRSKSEAVRAVESGR